LFSPQTYHQRYGGSGVIDGDGVLIKLPKQIDYSIRHDIHIPVDKYGSNLPMVFNVAPTAKEKKEISHHFRSSLAFLRRSLGFCGKWSVDMDEFEYEFGTIKQMLGACVSSEDNCNLTNGQKELLLWHWKLGISMGRVQELMRGHQAKEPNGNHVWMDPVIKPKFPSASNCKIPMCQTCELARAKKRNPKVVKQKSVKEKEAILSWDKYEAGDFVSMDHYIVSTPGRLLDGYGREGANNRYHGGTIFNDAATGIIWAESQVSLSASETLLSKARFEQFLFEHGCAEIKHLHSDNGVFSAEEFKDECAEKKQTQSFSGVGAQHQNAKAERAIQTIMWMARSFMLHVSLHWTERGVDDIALWPFAVKHAVWIYNRLPNRGTGMTPMELLTKNKADHRDLLRTHVWGCPTYVLDPKLQGDKKIPKFNRRARQAQFLGFSDQHSSLVALVRHLGTGFVSPQYHVVFDNKFETVYSAGADDEVVDAICKDIFENSRDWYVEPEYNEDGVLVYEPPPLDKVWLSEPEQRERKERLRRQRERNEELQRMTIKDTPTPSKDDRPPDVAEVSDVDSDDDSVAHEDADTESEGEDSSFADHPQVFGDNDDNSVSEGANLVPEGDGVIDQASNRKKTRKRKEYGPPRWGRDSKGRLKRADIMANISQTRSLSEAESKQYACTLGKKELPPQASLQARRRKMEKYRQYLARRQRLGDMTLHSMRMDDPTSMAKEIPTVDELMASPLGKFITLAINNSRYSGSTRELFCETIHPLFLKAQSAASKADNPRWHEAMSGEFAEEFWEAMKTEIATLEGMESWEVVDRTNDMNVLPSTWAFKIKRYPDGLIKKFKARFCARGDKQIEGVDYFETYAPVVQWTTIRLMLMLEVLLDLKSKQGDVTAAFLHAELNEGERVYIEMPQGFRQKGKVLSLNRTIYGLKQSPRAFWQYMVQKMEASGMKQSNLDPCLFVGEKVIAVVFVDDILFWAKDEKYIHDLALNLRELGVDLEQEEDAAGFLGVRIEKNKDGLLEMKQEGLIERVIEALGLDAGTTNGKWTPAEQRPLVKDANGEEAVGNFSYSSVVGMLLYLSGHSRPDIAFAVNCCARYMFCPKKSHELALKRIGRYLKATRDKGLILNPSGDVLKIDNYPDADFAGMYGYEENDDPTCVKSRTGYVITVADCPVLWQSKLQSETALSTMEAEIIALAHSCRELLPIMDMVKALSNAFGLPDPSTTMNVSIHEDNAGALVLAETLPPQFTPRSKWYHVKTIWWREQIVTRGITLRKIATAEQLGDIFTKSLPKATFEYLRKKLMGW
jgi:hypothetical protein